jgi:hypothetical protein
VKNLSYNEELGTWIMPASVRDLLKTWTTEELTEALERATDETLELNPASPGYQMWLMRKLGYSDELTRRAN